MTKANKLPKKNKSKKQKIQNQNDSGDVVAKFRNFWKTRKPILMYTFGFFIFMFLFAWIGAQDFFEKISSPLLEIYTKLSSFVLNIFGQDVSANGDILGSSSYKIQIKKGCDAIAPMGLFAVATLAFPLAFKWKWRGLLIGISSLFVLNIIRIVSLWLIGRYWKSIFDFAHIEMWQVIFIAFTIIIWLYWLKWALNKAQINGET